MRVTTSKSKNAESFYITKGYINDKGVSTSTIIRKLGTLQELCDALNPNKDTKPGLSVRMIRTKLRNLYVKLHPNGYIGIYPYEAFIDDWNEGECF